MRPPRWLEWQKATYRRGDPPTRAAIAGRRPAVQIGSGVKHAIIADNNGDHGVRIINQAGDRALLRDNEPAAPEK